MGRGKLDRRRGQRDRRGRSLEFMIRLESRFRLSEGTEKIQSLHCDITSCFSSTFLQGQQTPGRRVMVIHS